MPDQNPPYNEQRQQTRFPCVGIELLYSPLNSQSLYDVSQSLLQATFYDASLAGIAFDIKHSLIAGQLLLVMVKTPDGEKETLRAEVRWCKQLAEQQFRVGVSIVSVDDIEKTKANNYTVEPIGHGIAVPAGASFICPACEQRSWFVLIGQQEGVPPPALMPLYNCSECHTTRSIPSLLSYNRQEITGE